MHLLLCKGGLTPAKITHHFGAVGEGFVGPESNHSRVRGGIISGPVDRTRLLFQDPPAAPAAGSIQIVVKSYQIRITRTKIPALMRVRSFHLAQEPERVRVPTGGVQVFRESEMIKIEGPSHEIMKDRPARRELADKVDLKAIK